MDVGRLASWFRRSGSRPPERALLATALASEPGFVAVDLETTGLDSKTDAIVSAAVVPFVHGRAGPPLVDTLVDPQRPIPLASQRVHGITNPMVQGATTASTVIRQILDACNGRIVVGHEVAFDLAIVNRYAAGQGLAPFRGAALDVGRIAPMLQPRWARLSLEQLARHLDVPLDGRHTASGDATIAGMLLLSILKRLEGRGTVTIGHLLRFQRTSWLRMTRM